MNPNSGNQLWSRWTSQIRVEGKPAHDPAFQQYIKDNVARFMRHGFGSTASMKMDVVIEAGDTQDGQPPAQLLVLPHTASMTRFLTDV